MLLEKYSKEAVLLNFTAKKTGIYIQRNFSALQISVARRAFLDQPEGTKRTESGVCFLYLKIANQQNKAAASAMRQCTGLKSQRSEGAAG
jgi:hypothetical protein